MTTMAGATGDYESQGMALKLKELDAELQKYETRTYPCEAHLTWCCQKSLSFTIADAARDLGVAQFDPAGACTRAATHRVLVLDREEERSTGLARRGQPTLCAPCTQIAIDERIFREVITTEKADQLEQEHAKQMEAEARKRGKKGAA